MQLGMRWDGGGGGLRRVLPERVVVGSACSALGAIVGVIAIAVAGEPLWGLGWFALFAVVALLLTTFADLVPVQDGADAAQPAPRPPDASGGARTHLTAGIRGIVLVVILGGFATSPAVGGHGLARLGGVLLGAGLCSLASARWIANWERRTGQILLVGPGRRPEAEVFDGMPGSRRRWRPPTTPPVAYYVLPRDPAEWPDPFPDEVAPARRARRLAAEYARGARRRPRQRPGGWAEIDERAPSRWRWRSWRTAYVLGGVGFLTGLALTAAFTAVEPDVVLGRCPGVGPLPAAAAQQPVRLGVGVSLFAEANGKLWATSSVRQPWPSTASTVQLFGLDARTGRVVVQAPLDFDPSAMVAGGGWLWGISWPADGLTRVDPRTGRRAGPTVSLGGSADALAAGEGGLWVLMDDGRTVRRIDADTGRIGPPIATGGSGSSFAAGEGALWVSDDSIGGVRRIDARTGAITKIPLGISAPRTPLIGLGSVWVPGQTDLARVDPRSLDAGGQTINIGWHGDTVVAGGALWVAGGDGLFQIDPRCGRAIAPIVPTGGVSPDRIVPAAGTLWVSDSDGKALVPVRLAG